MSNSLETLDNWERKKAHEKQAKLAGDMLPRQDTISPWMATIGRKGGQQLTPAKRRQLAEAARRPRPGRARKTPEPTNAAQFDAIAAEVDE